MPGELNENLTGQLSASALLNADDETAEAGVRINRWPQLTAVAAVIFLAVGLGIVVYYVLPASRPRARQRGDGGQRPAAHGSHPPRRRRTQHDIRNHPRDRAGRQARGGRGVSATDSRKRKMVNAPAPAAPAQVSSLAPDAAKAVARPRRWRRPTRRPNASAT